MRWGEEQSFALEMIAPLTLVGLHFLGINAVSLGYYAIFKGIWMGIIAGALVIPMLLIALR